MPITLTKPIDINIEDLIYHCVPLKLIHKKMNQENTSDIKDGFFLTTPCPVNFHNSSYLVIGLGGKSESGYRFFDTKVSYCYLHSIIKSFPVEIAKKFVDALADTPCAFSKNIC